MNAVRQPNPRRPSNCGFTLVEALVAMTILAGVAVLSFRLLTLLFQVDHQSMVSSSQMLVIDRLADRFRQDIHAAESIEWIDPGTEDSEAFHQIDLNCQGMLVKYRVTASGIERLVPGTELTRPRQRDLFAVNGLTAEFTRAGDVVQLKLTRVPTARTGLTESMVIEAASPMEDRP